MSSNRPADTHSRPFAPRTWSLRARLLVTQMVLLTLVCAGIGVATELALRRFLVHQLDASVLEAGRRSAAIFELPPPPWPENHWPGIRGAGRDGPNGPGWPGSRDGVAPPQRMRFDPEVGPGPGFLNAPGQAARMVGAVIGVDHSVDAGVITADGGRAGVTAATSDELAAVAPDLEPRTVVLDGLGRYRVVALHPRHGRQVIVTGLPLADVDDTLLWVVGMFCVVGVIALVGAITAGTLIIRRQFAPLSRVAASAREVADLDLDRGEVRLPTAIARVDPAAAHTEIGQLSSALNRMLHRIAGALSARHASETRVRQFVADASHELRTPLAAIRGYTELVGRRHYDLPGDVAHALSRVESETARMTQLVEDMLLLARLDAGRPLERASVDLSRLVVDGVSDAHVAGPDHRWALDLPPEPVQVIGDEARLHQVLSNLLANARTHTPAGTTVTVALAGDEPGGPVVLTVSDDGPGIPEKLRPEVFERFARGDSSRSRRVGGTGLGLAIVAAVLKAHGGTIALSSVPGSTVFTVTLPGDGRPGASAGGALGASPESVPGSAAGSVPGLMSGLVPGSVSGQPAGVTEPSARADRVAP